MSKRYGLNYIPYERGVGLEAGKVFTGGGNSGFQAVNLALQWGYDCILVGFDMQATGGRKHWHADHKGNNPTEGLFQRWIRSFREFGHGHRIKVVGDSALHYDRTPLVPPCEGVIGVLRSGGWPTSEYAERLSKAIVERSTRFLCLTDMEPDCERLPLLHGWPGWWSKLEVCRPDIKGDWLYMDMDTIVVGDIEPLKVQRPAMLGDFYHPKLEAGVMYLTEPMRRAIWERWITDPDRWMAEYRGDGDFIRDTVGHISSDIRDVGGIYSYKVHRSIPEDARLICFHGDPRPHETRYW